MDSGKRDRLEGHVDEAKGRLKEEIGRRRGDEDQAAEGRGDQVEGNMEQGLGQVKGKVDDVVDKLRR